MKRLAIAARRMIPAVPWFGGVALLSLGAAVIYLPAGFIVAGALLLYMDFSQS